MSVLLYRIAATSSDTESADEALLDESVPPRKLATAVKSEASMEIPAAHRGLPLPPGHVISRSPDGAVRPTPIKIEVCPMLTSTRYPLVC